MSFSVKELVADKIIERIEKENRLPWVKPWSYDNIALKRNGEPYSFMNQLMLPPGEYITYTQLVKEGGKLKKGAKKYYVTFWKQWIPEEEMVRAKAEERNPKSIPLLRYFKVYNVEDTTIEAKHFKKYEGKAESKEDAMQIFNEYINRYGIKFVEEKSNEAYYCPSTDTIHMPLIEQFHNTNGYFGTLFHEATHSTGHESRLNRLNGVKYNNKVAYSREELVAEMGSCAILGHLGMISEMEEKNSAAYIKSWVKFIKEDKKAIVEASSKAQKAFEMIIGEGTKIC